MTRQLPVTMTSTSLSLLYLTFFFFSAGSDCVCNVTNSHCDELGVCR